MSLSFALTILGMMAGCALVALGIVTAIHRYHKKHPIRGGPYDPYFGGMYDDGANHSQGVDEWEHCDRD